jgi:hypothetical protein
VIGFHHISPVVVAGFAHFFLPAHAHGVCHQPPRKSPSKDIHDEVWDVLNSEQLVLEQQSKMTTRHLFFLINTIIARKPKARPNYQNGRSLHND